MGPMPRSRRMPTRPRSLSTNKFTIKKYALGSISLLMLLFVLYLLTETETNTVTPSNTASNTSTQSQAADLSASDTLNVAVAVLLTKDPGISAGFLDSITALSVSIDEAQSRHSITKIALIHEDITHCLPVLWHFNFKVVTKPLPIQLDEIENQNIVEDMKKSGCCGESELLKLHVWTMTEYDYVILMDADMHWHKNFDSIFDTISMGNISNAKTKNNEEYNGKYLAWTHGATAEINQEVMNGGFLVVRPNVTHYQDMVAVVKEGDWGPRGWKNSGIGWVYGGTTIQGIVPYYYFKAIGKGVADVELDRCVFNNMVEMDKCKKYEYSSVVANHFTVCQKPWSCIVQKHLPLCIQFGDKWWERSRKVEETLQLNPRERCPHHKYVPIDYLSSSLIAA